MRVRAGIDQFRVDAKPVRRALDRTFHNVGDAELLTYLAQIAVHATFVLTDTRVANDF